MIVDLDAAYSAVAVLPHRDGPRIVLFAPDRTSIRDASGALIATIAGARGAVVVDVDGDGKRDLVTCGDRGLVQIGWEGPGDPRLLSDVPCRAVVAMAGLDGRIATVDTSVRLWAAQGGVLVDRGPYGAFVVGTPLLASGGEVLAMASTDQSQITERRGPLRSDYAAGGAPGGIAISDRGVAWTLPALGQVTDALHDTFDAGPSPGPIVAARVRDHDVFYVLGADHNVRRIEPGGPPTVAAAAPGAAGLAVGDLDGDGCDEILTVGASLSIERDPTCPAGAPPAPPPVAVIAAPRVDVPGTSVLGIDIPPSIGVDPLDPMPGHWADRAIGVGGAFAGGLSGVWPFVPAFPTIAFESTWGGPKLRGVFGLDSSGFLLWVGPTTAAAHLLNVTFGAAAGGRDLQFGPIATLGIADAGLGVRAAWTPFAAPHEVGRMGVEARLIALAGGAGEADLMWIWRSEARRRPDRSIAVGGASACAGVALLAGVAGGFSSTTNAWEFVGRDEPFAPSFSPAFGVACEGKGLLLSMESAPIYAWLAPPDRERLHHMGSVSFGPMFGSDAVRIGPIGTLGIWTSGIGARVAIRPIVDHQGRREGLDLRAVANIPYGPSWEMMALWGVWLDPRRSTAE